MSAIAPSGRPCGTNSDEIVIGHRPQIGSTESDQRLRTTGRRDELDTERIRPINLDDGAKIAATQPMSGNVARQDDNIERMHRHLAPPGYAVTNRGTPRAVGTNQTLSTIAD